MDSLECLMLIMDTGVLSAKTCLIYPYRLAV